jgi:DNA-binding MarR family transcriptional regulator
MRRDAIGTTTPSASSINESETVRRLAELFCAFGPLYKRWMGARLESELGFTHQRALGELEFHGPMTMSALGAEVGVTPRYVTALVDGLEAQGLARRRPHPIDRRAILVELTPEGEASCLESGVLAEQINAELLAALSPEQQGQLLGCLEVLLAALQRRAGDGEPPSAA